MNTKLTVTAGIIGFFVILIALAPAGVGIANNTPSTTVTLDEWDANLTEILLAQASQEGTSYNLSAAYEELKDLAKQYRKAKKRGAQERIHVRAEEIMSQIFEAKVQHERKRLQVMEERLRAEKERLNQMQAHKRDLVNKGVEKALSSGEMPDWATDR